MVVEGRGKTRREEYTILYVISGAIIVAAAAVDRDGDTTTVAE